MRKDIILFFSITVVLIEVDGVRLNRIESYIVKNIFKVLRMSASGDRDYFIKGNNSIIPRVYGQINTSLSPRLGAFFDHTKKVKVIKGKFCFEDQFIKILKTIGSDLSWKTLLQCKIFSAGGGYPESLEELLFLNKTYTSKSLLPNFDNFLKIKKQEDEKDENGHLMEQKESSTSYLRSKIIVKVKSQKSVSLSQDQ